MGPLLGTKVSYRPFLSQLFRAPVSCASNFWDGRAGYRISTPAAPSSNSRQCSSSQLKHLTILCSIHLEPRNKQKTTLFHGIVIIPISRHHGDGFVCAAGANRRRL